MKKERTCDTERLDDDLVWRVETSQVLKSGVLSDEPRENAMREILGARHPVLYGRRKEGRSEIRAVTRAYAEQENLLLAPAAQVYAALNNAYTQAKRSEQRRRTEEYAVLDELFAERNQEQTLSRGSGCGCLGYRKD